ncbi:glycosyltransferase family 2 protein [Polynucleobacter sp. AP-Latsch-80-C2]|uniref:glycosyltransferase family 2 protein n=1 Tax=Polynucleobacter sp. AP-Latsch-80-C2 TaxID=2576931 RepID=UPI001C0C1B24|nr:glycosyltransferase [Polynucleobacter sp. AP-Latsch-80-C2]
MKVSIITVCYNSAKTLEHTIQSVLGQDYPQIEYIVIDGASKDGTLEIIQKHQSTISKWISESDRGMYDAMNKGIAMASGDVIGILNSDDVYMNNHVVSDLISKMKKDHADVVFADLILVDENQPEKILRYYDSGQFYPNRFQYGWMPAHPTVFVKKHIYDEVGLFKTDYQIAADYEMLIRILAVKKASYTYLPKPVVRMRAGGASTAGLSRNWILNTEIVRACKENGIYSNMAMLLLKIPAKLWGRIAARSIHQKSLGK